MEKTSNKLTIGVLADAAEVNVETIRFYQRKGLVPEPERPYGGIRRYTDADLGRVRFIKASQRLGFSLDEVGELLKLEDGTHCEEARDLAEHKLQNVREKLADLRRIETALGQLVARCGSARGAVKCPLISSLQETSAQGPKSRQHWRGGQNMCVLHHISRGSGSGREGLIPGWVSSPSHHSSAPDTNIESATNQKAACICPLK